MLTSELDEKLGAEAAAEVAAAVTEMESVPEPGAEYLFTDVYSSVPERVARQRQELAEEG